MVGLSISCEISFFLNRKLNEEVFIEQLKGFQISGIEHLLYKLHKALYLLKQTPGAWYEKIDSYFLEHGY